MGFSLRNWLEEATAQVNPFDNGKTAQTVRNERQRPAPAVTQNKRTIQNGVVSKPKQNVLDKVRDVFDANTEMDNYKRNSGLELARYNSLLRATQSPNVEIANQADQRLKNAAWRSQDTPVVTLQDNIEKASNTIGNFGKSIGYGIVEAPVALGRTTGNAIAVNTNDYKNAQASEEAARKIDTQVYGEMLRTLRDPTADENRKQAAINYLNTYGGEFQSGMNDVRAKVASENDPKRIAAASASLLADLATLGVAGASKAGVKGAYQTARAAQLAKGASAAKQVTTGLVAGSKRLGIDTAKTAALGGIAGGTSAYIQDPNATFKQALQGTAMGSTMGAGMPLAFIGASSLPAIAKVTGKGVKATTRLVRDAGKPTGKALQNLKTADAQLGSQIQDLLQKRSIAQSRKPELVPILDERINALYAQSDSIKKKMNTRNQGGFIDLGAIKETGDAIKYRAEIKKRIQAEADYFKMNKKELMDNDISRNMYAEKSVNEKGNLASKNYNSATTQSEKMFKEFEKDPDAFIDKYKLMPPESFVNKKNERLASITNNAKKEASKYKNAQEFIDAYNEVSRKAFSVEYQKLPKEQIATRDAALRYLQQNTHLYDQGLKDEQILTDLYNQAQKPSLLKSMKSQSGSIGPQDGVPYTFGKAPKTEGVAPTGKTERLYHGTNKDFKQFGIDDTTREVRKVRQQLLDERNKLVDTGKVENGALSIPKNAQDRINAIDREIATLDSRTDILPASVKEKGVYFTTDKKYAKTFAGKDGKIVEADVELNNPYIIKSKDEMDLIEDAAYYPKIIDNLEKQGYDGIKAPDGQVLVFDPQKAKLAQPTPPKGVAPKSAPVSYAQPNIRAKDIEVGDNLEIRDYGTKINQYNKEPAKNTTGKVVKIERNKEGESIYGGKIRGAVTYTPEGQTTLVHLEMPNGEIKIVKASEMGRDIWLGKNMEKGFAPEKLPVVNKQTAALSEEAAKEIDNIKTTADMFQNGKLNETQKKRIAELQDQAESSALSPQEEIQRIHNMAYRRGDKYTLTEEKRLAELKDQINNSQPVDKKSSDMTVDDWVQKGYTKEQAERTVTTKQTTKKLNDEYAGKKYNEGRNSEIVSDEDLRTDKSKSGQRIIKSVQGYKEYTDPSGNKQIRLKVNTATVDHTPDSLNNRITELEKQKTFYDGELAPDLEKELQGLYSQKNKTTPIKTEGVAPKSAPVVKPTLQDALEGRSTKVKKTNTATITKPKTKVTRKQVPQISEEMALTKTANQPPAKPPKPPTADGEIPALGTGKQKKTRYASKTVPESEFVSKPIKDTTKKNAPLYTPENEKLRYNEALTKYEKLGRDKFENDLYEQLNVKKGQINSSTVAEAQTLAAKLDAEGNYTKASEVYDKLSEHLTAAGQTIQAAAIMSRRSPEGLRKHAMQVWKKAGVKVTPEAEAKLVTLTQAVKTAKDTNAKTRAIYAVNEHVKKQVPDNIWNKSVNIWRAGLLTSPMTTAGNLFANTGETAIRKGFVNPVATAADAAMGLFTGKRTMSLAGAGSGTKGFKEGASSLPEYFKTGFQPNEINLKAKYENSGTINYGQGKFGKALGGYVNGVYRLMGVADAPYRQAATKEALSSMANAEALNKGLKGQAKQQFVDEYLANPPKEALQRASDEGTRATFQNDTLLNDIASSVKQKLEKGHPAAKALSDFVMPFVRTPSAIATRMIERTPIGLAKEIGTQIVNVKKGKPFDQRAMAQAIGNGSFGAVAIGAGMTLANADLMTFGYPTEKAERDLWELEGRQPYSVRVGNRWYSLNYLQPFGTLLAIGGQAKNDMDEGLSKGEAVTKALATAGQSIQEQSFLKGINGVLTAISDPEYSARKYMEQTFSSTVPNFVRGFARATDSVQRKPTTIPESVASAIPGLRQTTPVKNDALGRPIPAKDNFINQYVNPLRPSKVRDDAVAQELRKLKDNDLATMPTDINKSTYGDQQLSKAQINEATQYTNRRVSDEWSKVIKTKEYQSLTDEQKKKTLDSIKKDYHAVAKAEYAAKNNLINDQYEPKLSTRQKQVASGEAPDYVYGGLPDNMSKTAKNTLINAEGKDDAWKQSKNTDTEVTKALQSWLPEGVKLPEFTNETAKAWANYEKKKADGTLGKLEAESEKKTILRGAYNSQLNEDEKDLYKLSKTRLLDAYNRGLINDKNIENALAVEKQLYDAGLIDKKTLHGKLGMATGAKRSSRKSSGRKSGGKTRSIGNLEYKMFGFGDPKAVTGQLRKLIEQTQS